MSIFIPLNAHLFALSTVCVCVSAFGLKLRSPPSIAQISFCCSLLIQLYISSEQAKRIKREKMEEMRLFSIIRQKKVSIVEAEQKNSEEIIFFLTQKKKKNRSESSSLCWRQRLNKQRTRWANNKSRALTNCARTRTQSEVRDSTLISARSSNNNKNSTKKYKEKKRQLHLSARSEHLLSRQVVIYGIFFYIWKWRAWLSS